MYEKYFLDIFQMVKKISNVIVLSKTKKVRKEYQSRSD
ncbi:hypothetical protein SPARK1531C2_05407 [Klebsiella grimontii]|nr:hypothetical protein SPARK1531C2_05407 [Klebsiella grimontii]